MAITRTEINLKEFSHIKIGPESWVWSVDNSLEILDNPTFVVNKVILGNCSKLLLPNKLEEAFLNVDHEPVIEHSEGLVHVSSGTRLSDLLQYAMEEGLGGLDFMAGIPGTLGGLVWMNGGAFGRHVWNQIYQIRAITSTGEVIWLKPGDVDAEYRNSHLDKLGVKFVVDAFLYYKRQDKQDVRSQILSNIEYRKRRHPVEYPSLGSTFKNSKEYKAWELLTEVGLAGYRIGDAMFSTKHANFIINLGNATREDVLGLIKLGQARVYNRFGIWLEPEIVIL
ncbi:MAG TPA: UDP-N-acetylmuramate dehydrogenase [Coprothermobacter proteolyticus]|uniref:UDP-N-acetylmuramate dehydrogenase n=1 Tax=Coprothermobacter proteolyticus TaxID=35786 RepID=UPI000D31DE59|nr:UDP-N-acetylmuramate dehydrogenase [Coprothermobacter proteolyticus]HOL53699.1 UDP-N-acetylmuramate dehydrogenase [Coprothermobacter proteolyticus]